MKKHVYYILLFCLFAMTYALSSCSNSQPMLPDGSPKPCNAFGEVVSVGTDGYFEIMRDDRVLLCVTQYAGYKQVEPGERVHFRYLNLNRAKEQKSEQPTLNVKVIVFFNIHSAPLLKRTFLLDNDPYRSDSIGNDLVRICMAAFSGDYINIGFEYFMYADSKTPHLINLEWDDTRTPTDTVHIRLRHNAMGETDKSKEMIKTGGLASFKLTDIVPDGLEEIPVKLWYNMDLKGDGGNYVEVNKYCVGVFAPNMPVRTEPSSYLLLN